MKFKANTGKQFFMQLVNKQRNILLQDIMDVKTAYGFKRINSPKRTVFMGVKHQPKGPWGTSCWRLEDCAEEVSGGTCLVLTVFSKPPITGNSSWHAVKQFLLWPSRDSLKFRHKICYMHQVLDLAGKLKRLSTPPFPWAVQGMRCALHSSSKVSSHRVSPLCNYSVATCRSARNRWRFGCAQCSLQLSKTDNPERENISDAVVISSHSLEMTVLRNVNYWASNQMS